MSVKDCIEIAQRAGEIEPEEAAALKSLWSSMIEHYGEPNAAKTQMIDRLMRRAQHQKREAALTEQVNQRNQQFIMDFRDNRGQPDPAKAMISLLEHHGQTSMPEGMSSVEGRQKAIIGLAHAQMEEALHAFRRKWLSGKTRNLAQLDNVVRETFGEKTGDDAARGLASAWNDTSEWMRQRYNAAGGAIGKRKDWGMTQIHDKRALLAKGYQEWAGFIEARLNPKKMYDPLTGLPMTPADVRETLNAVYQNIVTDGWADREATNVRGGSSKLSRQRGDPRLLAFKDADAWLEYQAEFGGGANAFANMMNHIRGMATDIAAMEILGPNPDATLIGLQNFVLKQASQRAAGLPAIFPDRTTVGRRIESGGGWFTTVDPLNYARSQVKLAGNMWDLYNGRAGGVVDQRIADTFDTIRNLNVATKLGKAALSSVTDLASSKMARYFAGLPVHKVWGDVVKSFASGPKRDVVRAGLILETALHVLHEDARYAGSVSGPVWSRYLADRTIALSGLQAWTQAGKHGFGLAFMAQLASDAALTFGELKPAMQRTFRRYGLSEADWDAMRLDSDGTVRDVDLLSPRMLFDEMRQVGGGTTKAIPERYLEMILQETEYAVPTGPLQVKARVFGDVKRGTTTGELWRSALQFKMFALSVVHLQGQRVAQEVAENGALRGAGYAGALLFTSMLYGALAIQMKELANGRDPRPVDDPKFWVAAMLQSGGLGIYGDFIAAEANRMGGGFQRTLAGPSADVIAGGLSLISENAAQYFRGEKTNLGREAVRFLGQNTPGGSLWFISQAYQRVFLDQLQRVLDPDAQKSFRQRVTRQRKDYGNDYFWAPGTTSPQRGPRLPAAFGD